MFDDLLNSLGGLDAKAMIEMLTPKFKFALREDLKDMKQFLPTRTTDRSSGWDISCAWDDHKDHTVQPGEFVKIPLGIRCIPDEGYWYEVKPRSSTFVKKHLHALYGTVDNDYRDQLYFCAQYMGTEPITLEFGSRIGQIIPVKLQEMTVEEISNADYDKFCKDEVNERKGGFGSSGL